MNEISTWLKGSEIVINMWKIEKLKKIKKRSISIALFCTQRRKTQFHAALVKKVFVCEWDIDVN